MRILLVDDEPELLEQVRQILVQQKYTVDTALDGNGALEKIFTEPYDLIILDVMLPEKDGFTVLTETRKEKIHTPVLMLTARGDTEDRIKGLDLGADDYLAKPFSMAELLARLRALLKEFSIFEFLLYNKNRAVSRFTISEHVWGDEFDPYIMSNSIDVHIKNLRKKIGDSNGRIIHTVRGIGYMIRDEPA